MFISMSSSAEVQSHLYVALDQKYIEETEFKKIYDQADKAGRMISGLIKYLRDNQRDWELRSKKTKETKETKETRETKETK